MLPSQFLLSRVAWASGLVLAGSALLGCSAGPTSVAAEASPAQAVTAANTLVLSDQPRYQVSPYPERITLLPGAAASSSAQVTWRTNSSVTESLLQLAVATPSPGLHTQAKQLIGRSIKLNSPNGEAHHHRVQLSQLQPDTLYAYRVKGLNTWSSWHQFKTPAADFKPYTALYFGDAQNAVLSHYARTVREALLTAPRAKVMLYAGDLVNSRDGVHDDEWAEWFAATSWMAGSIYQLPAAGNHEFSSDDDQPIRYLLPHWVAHYEVAGNGPEALSDTVYYSDVQGVRYIALDSTEALQSEQLAQVQAQWLEQVLANNPNRWTVVFHHHPMHSVSMGRDNPPLRKYWQPLYDKYQVDLVLQGHDHTYGRDYQAASATATDSQGPVYAVSVAGPKMYLVSEQAQSTMDRLGEDTQLFQTLEFHQDRVKYQAFTATGELYDAFVLHKTAAGKQVEDLQPATAERRCSNPNKPKPHRCWNGTDLIHAPAAAQ
ncbi:MAG: metallophosphoesterase family protein [Pseudidiomarina maritima]|nr:metallophosphoesterase family protein [Pseudidiomarina maritima]